MFIFAVLLGALGCVLFILATIIQVIRGKKCTGLLAGFALCLMLMMGGGYLLSITGGDAIDVPGNPPSTQKVKRSTTPAYTGKNEPVASNVSKTTEPQETEQIEPIPKDSDEKILPGFHTLPNGVELVFYDTVQNDVTGRWRLSTTSSKQAPADYAIEYYSEMFSADNEVHGIWNETLSTMTCIKNFEGLLFIDTHEYVNGEQTDAKRLFSGTLLDSQIIDAQTGEPFSPSDNQSQKPENTTPATKQNSDTPENPKQDAPQNDPAPAKVSTPDTQPSNRTSTDGGKGNGSNFDTYDNADQQDTDAKWVLNTSSLKIHYPSCSQVRKIAPQNYAESNKSKSDLIAEGYTTCGVCHK